MCTGSNHNPPPSIGEIEAALLVEGKMQHRIWRIEMGLDNAIVQVHPDDAAGCCWITGQGESQVRTTQSSFPCFQLLL